MIKKEFKCSNIGDIYEPVLEPSLDEKGNFYIREVGKNNIRAEINSHAYECDINFLVARAMNGDPSALNQREGMYGDFTHMPKTFAEVCQKIIDGQNLFNSLSSEVKSKFDNDVMKFISSAGDDDFLDKIGFVAKEEDVKESVTVE